MSDEPRVRVRNGSVTIRIESDDPSVEWTQARPWRWLRRGAASKGLGQEWVFVNDTPIRGSAVRVTTTTGELFFTYVGGRTRLDTSVRLKRRDPDRRLLSSDTVTLVEVAVAEEPVGDDGPDWRVIDVPLEEPSAQP
jgi:hypothetical protein